MFFPFNETQYPIKRKKAENKHMRYCLNVLTDKTKLFSCETN